MILVNFPHAVFYAVGERGVPGFHGPEGSLGLPGQKGEPGAAGVTGQAGSRGLPGINGLPGIVGQKGNRGFQGQPGGPGMLLLLSFHLKAFLDISTLKRQEPTQWTRIGISNQSKYVYLVCLRGAHKAM